MRITGGMAAGRRLTLHRGLAFRPTTDRIREALFNILGPPLGVAFLDLYAGSGAVGLEALSRGARKAVFVDRDAEAARIIGKNVEAFGFGGSCEMLTMEAGRGIELLSGRRERFDILFADPPYGEGWIDDTLRRLGDGSLAAVDGILILQHSRREVPDEPLPAVFSMTDQRRYGDTVLSFIKFKAEAGERVI
ncbi:MAG: 16S rRNA (guanine(966)-N(2))-methyltransferase RsmD [Deltaproteobacteria bacterium]|nr:16S rRNA (guanine(966)-N(2))-methyltransferase RsmD [Deltaproteobacteria bacterium]